MVSSSATETAGGESALAVAIAPYVRAHRSCKGYVIADPDCLMGLCGVPCYEKKQNGEENKDASKKRAVYTSIFASSQ